MDYQMNNQPPMQPTTPQEPMAPAPAPAPMNGGGSRAVWYIVAVLVIIGLALWYFFGTTPPAPSPTSSVGTAQTNPPGSATADLQASFDQTDTSADMSQDMASSAAAIQGL